MNGNTELRPRTSPLPTPRSGIRWGYEFRQYGATVLVAAPLFLILSLYLLERRGYYNLFIANKIFAGIAAILLGIVVLLGPLSRFMARFAPFLQYRKEFGIVAALLALVHGLSSLFFLPDRFPLQMFLRSGLVPFLFGLMALLTLLFLLAISHQKTIDALGHAWRPLQNWGIRAALLALVLHVGIMKIPGWLSWYQKGGSSELHRPDWPGAGILVGWFLVFVILIRLAEFGGKRFGRSVAAMSAVALPFIYLLTFLWGQRFQ